MAPELVRAARSCQPAGLMDGESFSFHQSRRQAVLSLPEVSRALKPSDCRWTVSIHAQSVLPSRSPKQGWLPLRGHQSVPGAHAARWLGLERGLSAHRAGLFSQQAAHFLRVSCGDDRVR